MNKIMTYSALMLVLSAPLAAHADNTPVSANTSSSVDKQAALAKQKLLAEKSRHIIAEAKDAVFSTQQALMSLTQNDKQSALIHLQNADKKLAEMLAKNPGLTLATSDVEADVYDFTGDSKTLANLIKQADDLLDSGKLQNARQILSGLASEMQITTVDIPLVTYPAAIKNAIAQIHANKPQQAAQALDDVLNTLQENTEVTPLPIVRAEALLTIASELEHRDDLAKEQSRADILKFTDAAKEKLKVAELLGYGGKEDYKELYTAIDEIQDVVHSQNSGSVWARVKQHLSDLRNKISWHKQS